MWHKTAGIQAQHELYLALKFVLHSDLRSEVHVCCVTYRAMVGTSFGRTWSIFTINVMVARPASVLQQALFSLQKAGKRREAWEETTTSTLWKKAQGSLGASPATSDVGGCSHRRGRIKAQAGQILSRIL